MSSSSRLGLIVAALTVAGGSAVAQQQAQGFAVERFYPSAPSAGWFVMDDLDIHGGLGGGMALTLGYSSNPLRVTDGVHHLAVVSDQAFADVGAAITYSRWRFYLNLVTPLAVFGESGIVGAHSFSGPAVDPGSNPDVLSDARIGADMRVFGRPGGHFRLGVSAQLFIPFGNRADYITDGDFRGMIRLLFAGDARYFAYAVQLGVHIRPLDVSPADPKGSELLFGVAAGAKVPIANGRWAIVVGPEIYGASAFQAFLLTNGTALEALVSGRLEGTREDKAQVRVKLAVGGGINQHFGAPEWRIVTGVELFTHNFRKVPRVQ
jgi:hypothetical protein